jgi:hypothetical protein
MISVIKKNQGEGDRGSGCRGLTMCWAVGEGLTYKVAFEESEKANQEATLARVF